MPAQKLRLRFRTFSFGFPTTKKRRKVAAKKKPAPKKVRKPPPESLVHKVEHEVEDVVTEIADIFTDAERLHQKLDPGISREPE